MTDIKQTPADYHKSGWSVWHLIGGVLLILLTFSGITGACFALFSYLNTANEIKSNFVHIDPDNIDPANESKAVYVYGEVKTDSVLTDPMFNVKTNALYLWRIVEKYEVDEKQLEKENESMALARQITGQEPSGIFNRIQHGKSDTNPFLPWSDYSKNVTLGKFLVDDSLVKNFGGCKHYRLSDSHINGLKFTPPSSHKFITIPAEANYEYLYIRQDAKLHRIGDYRISFGYTEPGYYSLIARQQGKRLVLLRQDEELFKNMKFSAPGKVEAHSLVESEMVIFLPMPLAGIFLFFICGICGFSILQPVFGAALGFPVKKGNLAGGDIGLFALFGAVIITALSAVAGWLISF